MSADLVNLRAIERGLRQLPQVELPTDHFLADGMYARRLFRKMNVAIVGRVHKLEHFYIVARGCVAVSGIGEKAQIRRAGDVVISQPGTKRVVLALEDSVCLTVHNIAGMANWKTATLEEIEDYISFADPNSMYGTGNTLKELPCL